MDSFVRLLILVGLFLLAIPLSVIVFFVLLELYDCFTMLLCT